MTNNPERITDDMVENLKRPSAWLRVLFMAGFVVALYITGIILTVLILAQIIFSLLTGADNDNMRRLGSSLSVYVSQILAYLTYNSEIKPFPFRPFPAAAEELVSEEVMAEEDVTEEVVIVEDGVVKPAHERKPRPDAPASDYTAADE